MLDSDIEMSDSEFAKLRAIVHKNTGITIGENRKSMLLSRLRRRLREVDAPNFSSYISGLVNNPGEMQELTNRVTTNETYFYRTPRVWEHFENEVVPKFLKARHARPLKIWSAAASTGEEAHTIGVLLEDLRQKHQGFEYSVLGTDVSSRVLKIAETGLYKGRAIARFQKAKPDLFKTHMIGNDTDGFQADPAIKKRLKFKLHNLLERLKSTGSFDVVFLRNVLIYFTKEDQETILNHVRDQIRPEGTLYIGESETLTNLDTGFEQVLPIIYRPVLGTGRPADE